MDWEAAVTEAVEVSLTLLAQSLRDRGAIAAEHGDPKLSILLQDTADKIELLKEEP